MLRDASALFQHLKTAYIQLIPRPVPVRAACTDDSSCLVQDGEGEDDNDGQGGEEGERSG